VKLFYRKFGKGKPLIILHGLFGLSDNWVTIGKKLSENYGVILVDLRNHGHSPHSALFTYQAMSDDLLELYEELNISDATIIGHSMGGKVAMQFTLENPAKVEKLVVVDIAPKSNSIKHFGIIQVMQQVDFNKLKTRTEVEQYLEQTVKQAQIRQLLQKNLHWVDKTHLGWKLSVVDINNNIEEVFKGISGDIPFTKPTLFIKGALSDYIKDEDLGQIKLLFPGFILNTIENAGHWVHADNPVAFLKVLNSFLLQA
jgi:esterase